MGRVHVTKRYLLHFICIILAAIGERCSVTAFHTRWSNASFRTTASTKSAFLDPREIQHLYRRQRKSTFSRKLTAICASHNGGNDTNEDTLPNDVDQNKLDGDKVAKQAELFWEMAFPYFDESKAGRWLFAGMIALTLLNSGVSVVFSYLGKDFWNALSARDTTEFYNVLTKYVGALLAGAPIVTLFRFQRERLAVHWREWMTDRTLQLYESNRVYYALEREREIDNPDQRIAEDVNSFTSFSLQLFLSIITSSIDLVSFSLILYSIYPQLFLAIVAYAAFGTVTTAWLGQDLVRLNFEQLQKEADFRYSLVRLRENAESIAFYAGEDLEGRAIQDRLKRVIANTRDVIGTQRNLEFFTNGYRFMIQLLPVAVVAPRYFAGAIELGVISQSVGAFNHILNDLSIIVNKFEELSRFSAGIDRLSTFLSAIRSSDPLRSEAESLLYLMANNTTTTSPAATPSQQVIATTTTTTTSSTTNCNNDTAAMINGDHDIYATSLSDADRSTLGMIQLRQLPPAMVVGENGFVAPSGDDSPILSIEGLDLSTPDRKRVLIRDLSLRLKEGQNLLIVGDSGAGKSSLLRGIAGLWTAGNGTIVRPCDQDVYFLPQRPYCTLGSLKDQLLYPSLESIDTDDYPEGHVFSRSHVLKKLYTDEDLLNVLEQVDLGELAARASDNGDPIAGLEKVLDWSNTLSLGEQQRLAFGRVLVNRPRLVILDEATSALDLVAEAKMYSLLQNLGRRDLSNTNGLSAPGLTYISVGHRPSLLVYHDLRLRLGGKEKDTLEAIEKSSMDMKRVVSNL